MTPSIDDALITKQTLHPGKEYISLKPGTRVKFHFQTRKAYDGQLLDDSRAMSHPMELVLGKKFKLEVWEVIVQKMALNEVAKFTVHKSLVTQYPFISKTLRDVSKNTHERSHCCGMTLQNEGIGYKDLDDLLAKPCDLEFIIELFSIEHPEEYEKERWQMDDAEKMNAQAVLREKGNQLYREKKYKEAEECYCKAVGMIEQLMTKEKPHDEEWLALAKIKVPLLLNYAQCRLLDCDYYAVIEHCTEALDLDKNNIKALFRRAKAHAGAWNPVEARRDFLKAAELDPGLKAAVNKELQALDEGQRIRDAEDKKRLQKLF
ncbi:PREDICTED: AH receptor-interacting protein [Rhagoletis zephyria]|uniref:AH receptor-interacting protein n=1 Tax=Rhagoletis zephyria TaxID=28612 RepID=UPI000811653D|nr:PREDICTED: AH receptor-interacting protein [Rhagoletis zephyria]XP_017473514.1 PREDICTED: AH receptor-interacting protein [Rhagoletis zephyria]